MGNGIASSRELAKSWRYRRYRHYQEKLQRDAADWFGRRECKVRPGCPYILAKWEDWPSNTIEPAVAQFVQKQIDCKADRDAFPLHKYVHHGLSSQAALFNLVVPMVLRDDLTPLREAITASGVAWPSGTVRAEFEHEDRKTFNEDAGQPTSIDLTLSGDSGAPLMIESKLSESEFGGCSVFACGDCDGRNPAANLDDCYLNFIGRRYWEMLGKYGFLDGPLGRDATCILASHYQFFREFLFALEHGGTFVLLYDHRNPTFYSAPITGSGPTRGLMPLLEGLVPDHLRHRLAKVTFVAVLTAAAGMDCHRDWALEFSAKYAGRQSDALLGAT